MYIGTFVMIPEWMLSTKWALFSVQVPQPRPLSTTCSDSNIFQLVVLSAILYILSSSCRIFPFLALLFAIVKAQR
jgi:hypothetical protein